MLQDSRKLRGTAKLTYLRETSQHGSQKEKESREEGRSEAPQGHEAQSRSEAQSR
jgi:hypothetical protein